MKSDPAPKSFAAGQALAGRFEEMVNSQPDAIALRWNGQSMTYRDLNARANRLADVLRRSGVVADTRVGIHLDRSFDLIVAIFATLKDGGAYLPLDMDCPEDRLRFQVQDASVPVVLTDSTLAP